MWKLRFTLPQVSEAISSEGEGLSCVAMEGESPRRFRMEDWKSRLFLLRFSWLGGMWVGGLPA